MTILPSLDSVKPWVDRYRVNGQIKPWFLIRTATDSNWLYQGLADDIYAPRFPAYGGQNASANVLMNTLSPGMRIPGVLNWSVNESVEDITSTATLECLNALPISKVQTTLATSLPQRIYNPTILYNLAYDSNGVLQALSGNRTVASFGYRETDLVERLVSYEPLVVSSSAGFPDPRVPNEEYIDEVGSLSSSSYTYWSASGVGVGAYYLLIDNEVVRITDWDGGNTFHIPPGGRAVNGVLESHNAGATVTLLGFPPFTGKWTAPGYMTPDDYRPYRTPMRNGTALVSYEGYGDVTGHLSKSPDKSQPYAFTGYWFTKRPNSTLSDDGVPKIQFDLLSTAYILTHQKITQEGLYASHYQYNAWSLSVFDNAGLGGRAMPGDWVDFHRWDPTLPNAYPLKIYTELGQHKEFFEHMTETEFGLKCQFCQQEYRDFIAFNGQGKFPIEEVKSVGKHIYRESIRTYNLGSNLTGPPIRTWLRLPISMALGQWDHPLVPGAIAQRWTKMPQRLFNTLRTLNTGRIWNSQLSFILPDRLNDVVDIDIESYDSQRAYGSRIQLTCPFQATYDKQDWTAPILDFADVNNMTFFISRSGYPVFVPRGFRLRGLSGADGTGDWHMALGESISSYSHDVDADSIFTSCAVTAQTAFGTSVTLTAGGTTFDLASGQWLWESGRTGNRDGLQLTGGVAQADTISLDHLLLGFDWNTDPAGFGVPVIHEDTNQLLEIFQSPLIPQSPISLSANNYGVQVQQLRYLIVFMLTHFFIPVWTDLITLDNTPVKLSTTDKVFDLNCAEGVRQMQIFFKRQVGQGFWPNFTGWTSVTAPAADGVYNYKTMRAAQYFFNSTDGAGLFIKLDPWWWVLNGFPWDDYVAHIVGLPIPERKYSSSGDQVAYDSTYVYDQAALQEVQSRKEKLYHHMLFNVGNKVVDESINKGTVRQVSSNIADPRVEIGDVIWLEIAGFQSSRNIFGDARPPYTNGVYVTNITRNLDLTNGTYTANYSGYRFRGVFGDTWANNNEVYYSE